MATQVKDWVSNLGPNSKRQRNSLQGPNTYNIPYNRLPTQKMYYCPSTIFSIIVL